jgi:hypothetical protein
MNTALATAKAVLTIPGTVPQALHPPAVTRGAFYTSALAFVIAALPYVAALAGLGNPLSALFGAVVAGKIVAVGSIVAALIGVRASHVAATGRSIVPSVDNPSPDPPAAELPRAA